MVIFEFISEPKDKAYYKLLEYMSECCDKFSLTIHDNIRKNYSVGDVLEELEGYLIEVVDGEYFPFNNYCGGKVYIYRLSSGSLEVLKDKCNSLFGWKQPELPEDLSFFDRDWDMKLFNVAHEEMGALFLNNKNEIEVLTNYTGLKVKLYNARYNEDITDA